MKIDGEANSEFLFIETHGEQMSTVRDVVSHLFSVKGLNTYCNYLFVQGLQNMTIHGFWASIQFPDIGRLGGKDDVGLQQPLHAKFELHRSTSYPLGEGASLQGIL